MNFNIYNDFYKLVLMPHLFVYNSSKIIETLNHIILLHDLS